MDTKTFTQGHPRSKALKFSVKRYRFQNFPTFKAKGGIILVLVHGVGFHKESFEPLLHEVNKLQGSYPIIKEAWAFDCPNHGESAVLNDPYLFSPAPILAPIDVTLEDYSLSGVQLLQSGLIEKNDDDHIIIVGHSVGAIASIYMAALYHQMQGIKITGFVLIEPPAELFSKNKLTKQKSEVLIAPTMKRKDIWTSKQEALSWMSIRPPWKSWDKRALELYVEYGLCDLPTSGYPTRQGVTLSCHRMHEVFAYGDLPEFNTVLDLFPAVREAASVHVICGTKSFLCPSPSDRAKIARAPGMSIDLIPKGDHLMVQEIPEELAQTLYRFLSSSKLPKKTTSSKL